MQVRSFPVCALTVVWLCFAFQSSGQSSQEIGLPTLDKFELHNVKAEAVTYRGHSAIRVTDVGAPEVDDASGLIVPGSSFQDGTIEVDLSGDTVPDAPEGARGFVGISFRVSSDRSHFERFYLRPKNARMDDPMINYSETILSNTSPLPDSRGKNCAPRVPASMNRTSIWCQDSGRASK
jgi:hypothetical protein